MKPIENTCFVLGTILLFAELQLTQIHVLTGFSKSTIQSILLRSKETYPGTDFKHESSTYSEMTLCPFLDEEYVIQFAKRKLFARLKSLSESGDISFHKNRDFIERTMDMLEHG